MTKTVIEKVASSSSEAAVFKVGGTLGYHENQTFQKFFQECRKRNICKIVLDFSGLRSVGGGCARIIQEAATQDGVVVAIVGASPTVLKFLQNQAEGDYLLYASSVEEAVGTIEYDTGPPGRSRDSGETDDAPDGEPQRTAAGEAGEERDQIPPESGAGCGDTVDEVDSVIDDVDELLATPLESEESPERDAAEERPAPRSGKDAGDGSPTVILLGHDIGDGDAASRVAGDTRADGDISAEVRQLKRKVVHYNTLLSISSDFNRLDNRSSIIDAFLLTTIAQIGVESAAFYEAASREYVLAASKGFDGDPKDITTLPLTSVRIDEWRRHPDRYEMEQLPIEEDTKGRLLRHGFSYGALLIIQDSVRGIFLLGKSIRSSLDSDWFDLFRVLMSQAALSYEKTIRLEEESQRTLGLVQTLISLIEENTLGKGTTNLVTTYTYALAQRLEYPKEFIKDLIFATVLRDIGMIKVSDLIVRSPRELVQEEWEIIKRHPLDGSDMLSRMNFSQHTRDIVKSHHERFNGEGYPDGIEGHAIPLGSRIISVVESYGAMLRDRPHRPALDEEQALQTLKENWGLRYDPEVVDTFAEIVENELSTGERFEFDPMDLFTT